MLRPCFFASPPFLGQACLGAYCKMQIPASQRDMLPIRDSEKEKLSFKGIFYVQEREDQSRREDTKSQSVYRREYQHNCSGTAIGYFVDKLKKAKMKQSMSRVAKCIDNGPMEGFWGILKRERYYGR